MEDDKLNLENVSQQEESIIFTPKVEEEGRIDEPLDVDSLKSYE